MTLASLGEPDEGNRPKSPRIALALVVAGIAATATSNLHYPHSYRVFFSILLYVGTIVSVALACIRWLIKPRDKDSSGRK